jgi:hypothetical protein
MRPFNTMSLPLLTAAVDAHVANDLIHRCILAPEALGGKTRLMVTHNMGGLSSICRCLRQPMATGILD